MSSPEERVELVRRGYEAYNAGDLDALLDLFDPDIEVWASPDMLNSGSYRGHEGFLRWISQWNEAWEAEGHRLRSRLREGRRVYLGAHSSFDQAMAEAREREGLPRSEGAA
jgi:ketosteroid isomerase-like protein